ncbi:murein biosynthesis integral membrane protein MurJ [Lysinimonas soli]|uniref:Murein biosynthesis integral membrane protein MurJ n=1 Tax=Lysinimonas soli TaxID=1074233 RepID=A0ABW0NSL3_9MICO
MTDPLGPPAARPVAKGRASGALRGGLGRASAALASGTLVSRALGFISAAVLAWTIGQTGQGANAFAIANQLPNNIYAIIAGGLLSAVLVPQIVRAAHDDDGGQRFVNRLVTLGVVAFLVIALLATLCAPLLVQLYTFSSGGALSPQGIALAVAFAYWCLPQVFFYALYSLLGEVLNARGVFGPFTWAPVLNNVVAIAGLVVFTVLFGVNSATDDPASWDAARISLLAGSATLGVAAQALILLVFWRRTGLGFHPDFHWRGVGLGATGRAAGWTFGMILITQMAGVVQGNVALNAGAADASVAVLRTAWLVFMLPHSIIAVSIATPYFTRMSGHARDGDLGAVRSDLSSSLRTILLLVTGSAVALVAAALPFAAFFARNGREVLPIGVVLLAFLVGLVPFSALFLVQRTFYALGDTRTPFFVQLVQSGLFVAGALLTLLLPPDAVAAGIAIVTTIAGTVQALLAAYLLRRRLGALDGRRVLRRIAVYLLAAVPALAAGLAVLFALGGLAPIGLGASGFALAGRPQEFLSVVIVGGVTAVVYLGVLGLTRIPELGELVTPALRMLRRRS